MLKKSDKIINADELVADVIRDHSSLVVDCIDQIHDLPDTRQLHRLSQIQSDMASGHYNLDEKLGDVATAIVRESSSNNDPYLV